MDDRFIWATAGPKARAEMVRSHRKFEIPLLRSLFCLTKAGVVAILNGADWTPASSTETECTE